jgi:hypothetical protein
MSLPVACLDNRTTMGCACQVLARGLAIMLVCVGLAACGSSGPSTRALLSTACTSVSDYDQNAIVRMSDGAPAGYAACAAPGEQPAIDSLVILRAFPGRAYTVAFY